MEGNRTMNHTGENLMIRLEIRAEVATLQKVIVDYLDTHKIDYQVENKNENSILYWIIAGQKKPLGFIQVQRTEQGTMYFWVCWIVYAEDTATDKKERYIWFKGLLQPMIRDFLNPDVVNLKVEVIENRLTLPPLTMDEYAEVEIHDQEKRELRRQQGFVKQVVLDRTFETSSEAVRELLKKYIYRQRELDNHFWKMIDPDFWLDNKAGWIKDIFISGKRNWTDLGRITVIQLNPAQCKIIMENTWEAIPFMPQDEADAFYFETLRELSTLKQYLVLSIPVNENLNKTSEQSTDQSVARTVELHDHGKKGQFSLADEGIPAWERVKDYLYDRQLVEMWHKGFQNSEIANTVGVTPKRITNRITELRNQYGVVIIPYRMPGRKSKKTRDIS
jgi:hypothetical protein